MKKLFLYTLTVFAVIFFCQAIPAEAKHHYHRKNTQVQLNIGSNVGYRDSYVVRRYVTPPTPVVYYPAVPYATPIYIAPSPYVEEVYVAPAHRPLSFAGLSFTWNFLR